MISQIDTHKYYLENRGNKMTLVKHETCIGTHWTMYTDNASRRAYKAFAQRDFDSLADVEKHYKSWKGIAALANN